MRAEDLPAYLEALFELNHRRWSKEGMVGTFRRKPLERAFYTRFAKVALANGWLRLFALRLGDEIKAIQYGYAYNGTFFQMQEGFDPEAPAGIGNVLRAHVIDACVLEGIHTYDFLGEHTEHKRRWLARERSGQDLFVTHSAPLSTTLRTLRVWPTGRYLRPVNITA